MKPSILKDKHQHTYFDPIAFSNIIKLLLNLTSAELAILDNAFILEILNQNILQIFLGHIFGALVLQANFFELEFGVCAFGKRKSIKGTD